MIHIHHDTGYVLHSRTNANEREPSFTREFVLLIALLGVFGGCASEDPDYDNGDTALADSSDDADVGDATDADGGFPEPAVVEVSVSPDQETFQVGETVIAEARVFDADDNQLEDVDVTFSIDADDVAQPQTTPGSYLLIGQGTVAIRGCVPMFDGTDLCDAVSLVVAHEPPELAVLHPVPGAELGGDGTTMIEVSGSVDAVTRPTLEVNGESVEVDMTGAFSVSVTPHFGVNHLEVAAFDEHGDESRVTMDVLWANSYLHAVDEELRPQVSVVDAGVVQLGQATFDDDRVIDLDATPLAPVDLAGMMELVVTEFDLHEMVADPVVDNPPTMFLQLPDLRVDEVEIDVEIADGGAEVVLSVASLEVDTTGSLSFGGSDIDLFGSVIGEGIVVRGVFDMTTTDTRISIDTTLRDGAAQITIDGLVGDFREPEASAAFMQTGGPLYQAIDGELRRVIQQAYIDVIGSMLGEAMNSLTDGVAEQQRTTSSAHLEEVALTTNGHIAALETQTGNWMRTPVGFTLFSDLDAVHPASRGVADMVQGDLTASLSDNSLLLAVRFAVLNGALHCLWNSGLLEVEATAWFQDVLGSALSSAHLSGRLAPVLSPAQGLAAGNLVLSVGQLELELVDDGQTHRFAIHVEADTELSLTKGTLSVSFAADPDVRVWRMTTTEPASGIDNVTIETLIRDQFLPELFDALRSELSVHVPSFALGDLGGLAPGLSGFEPGFESSADPQTIDNYWLFELEFRAIENSP